MRSLQPRIPEAWCFFVLDGGGGKELSKSGLVGGASAYVARQYIGRSSPDNRAHPIAPCKRTTSDSRRSGAGCSRDCRSRRFWNPSIPDCQATPRGYQRSLTAKWKVITTLTYGCDVLCVTNRVTDFNAYQKMSIRGFNFGSLRDLTKTIQTNKPPTQPLRLKKRLLWVRVRGGGKVPAYVLPMRTKIYMLWVTKRLNSQKTWSAFIQWDSRLTCACGRWFYRVSTKLRLLEYVNNSLQW